MGKEKKDKSESPDRQRFRAFFVGWKFKIKDLTLDLPVRGGA